MKQHIVKVKSVNKVTHDVLQIVTEKPPAYTFIPGQANDVSINNQDWKEKKHSHLPVFPKVITSSLRSKRILRIKALQTWNDHSNLPPFAK